MFVKAKTAAGVVANAALGAAGWRTHPLLQAASPGRAMGVLAFDFDADGAATAAIADLCQNFRREKSELPIYCQSGTFAELQARGANLEGVVNLDEVVRRVLGSGVYVNTHHVAATARSVAGVGVPLQLVCHGAHLRRAVLACQANGVPFTLDLNAIHEVPWNEWSAPQCWTRRQLRAAVWWPREFSLLMVAESRLYGAPPDRGVMTATSSGGSR